MARAQHPSIRQRPPWAFSCDSSAGSSGRDSSSLVSLSIILIRSYFPFVVPACRRGMFPAA